MIVKPGMGLHGYIESMVEEAESWRCRNHGLLESYMSSLLRVLQVYKQLITPHLQFDRLIAPQVVRLQP